MTEWSVVIVGAAVGFVVGLVGIGGGALMTPILVLGLGVPPLVAVGTDLWFAALTKLLAVKLHHVKSAVDWQVVRRLWLGSLPASALALLWMQWAPIDELRVEFFQTMIAFAILITAIGLIFKEKLHMIGRCFRVQSVQKFKALQGPLTVLAGVLLGILVTLTSVGAGALGTVLLAYLYPLRLTPVRIIATELAHAVPLALFAGIGYLIKQEVDWFLLLMLLFGSVPTVFVGVQLSHYFPRRLVQKVLSFFLIMMSLILLAR